MKWVLPLAPEWQIIRTRGRPARGRVPPDVEAVPFLDCHTNSRSDRPANNVKGAKNGIFRILCPQCTSRNCCNARYRQDALAGICFQSLTGDEPEMELQGDQVRSNSFIDCRVSGIVHLAGRNCTFLAKRAGPLSSMRGRGLFLVEPCMYNSYYLPR